MTQPFQVTFDAADPAAQAKFWALALGYQEEAPPAGFESWEGFARSINLPEREWNNFAAVVDPNKRCARLFFQKVPEGKTAKNRVHLDVNASRGKGHGPDGWALVMTHVQALTAAGATLTREVNEPHGRCMVMADPEGNEFCVQ